MTRYKIGLAMTAAALAAADQLSKACVRGQGWSRWPWPGIFEFTDHRNFGLIANLPVPLYLIFSVTWAVTALIIHRLFFSKNQPAPPEAWPLALVLGGALGNLADRIRLGYVHDWAMFFGTSIVNLADAAIALGLLGYALAVWRRTPRGD